MEKEQIDKIMKALKSSVLTKLPVKLKHHESYILYTYIRYLRQIAEKAGKIDISDIR